MDYDGDIVMDDYPLQHNISHLPTQTPLADLTMTFGKFKGEKMCDLPSWYLNWLSNIDHLPPTFQAALAYALAVTRFSEMEVDWYPPDISAARQDFHQWRMLKQGMQKSMDTALWITGKDIEGYCDLSDEILGMQKVPKLTRGGYVLYRIWSLAQVYMTEGEADVRLRDFKSRTRAIGGVSPRKPI